MQSWIPYDKTSDFPIENLPWGIFSDEQNPQPRVGIAIGEYVLDIGALADSLPSEVLGSPEYNTVFHQPSLNAYISLPPATRHQVRSNIQRLLSAECPTLRDAPELRARCLRPRTAIKLHLPVVIGDYTDFYCGQPHAQNCGTMIRGKDNAMQPNWFHLPVGYHGRASTVVVSGAEVRRPLGQWKPNDSPVPAFGASRNLDYEMEVGFIIGGPSTVMGEPVKIEKAEDHIFGVVLLNDWSARDIQRWEAVPLGPFLSKSFATTISPWIVELCALKPHRPQRQPQQPALLPYLCQKIPLSFDVTLSVEIKNESMNEYQKVCETNLSNCYYSPEQLVAHHTINGCKLNPGDLFGTGTLSGDSEKSLGCLLELTWNGTKPFALGGKDHSWLEDGDTVRMRGFAQGDGYRIGFGDCVGKVIPALDNGL